MKKSNKWIALLVVMMMSVTMLASCAGGRTYEDLAGSYGAVSVEGKDEVQNVPYTGDPIIDIVTIPGDTIYVTNEGGTGNDNDINGSNSNDNSEDPDDNENIDNGNDQDIPDDNDEDEDIWDEDSGIPKYTDADIITILDQNVRCISDAGTHPGTTLENRHLRLKHQVDSLDPDVMGFQEVTPKWLEFLKEDYKDQYDYYHCFRESGTETGGGAGDECEPVFWKKDRFTKLDAGHFWLGDTPNSVSIFAGQTDQHRICNWVKLKNNETGKQFVFASVHYSLDNKAREKSAAVMNSELERISNNRKLPIIVVGDYNMNISSPEYNALVTEGLVGDLNFELNLGYDEHSTSSGYKTPADAFDENGEYINQKGIIDFVMISYDSTGLYPLHYEVLQKKFGSAYNVEDDYVSDHFGIHAKVVIPS
ncbi:MAG: endonuclease/exonuclease/phosphatase family protein [Clostridia bacterium]|nr:endonuclease/exonuclease/phosphatase family protein [Clostridia bacterium]